MSQNFKFGNLTDVGLVRKANEDYYGCFDTQNGYVFVICDGMGGHVGGAVASQTAVAAIKTYFETPQADIFVALRQSMEQANEALLQKIKEAPELDGMGTTCVLVVVKNGLVYYGHIGDSRIYIVRDGEMKAITKDHSFVQSLVDEGHITEEEAEKHPNKNQITKALGIHKTIDPSICSEPITPSAGDYFLLCSDGLTGMASEADIRETIIDANKNVQEKVIQLIDLAKEGGGKDNITAQLIEFLDFEVEAPLRTAATTEVHLSNKNITQVSGNGGAGSGQRKMWPLLSLIFVVALGALAYFMFGNSTASDTKSNGETASVKVESPQTQSPPEMDSTVALSPSDLKEDLKPEVSPKIEKQKQPTPPQETQAANNKISLQDIPLPNSGATVKPQKGAESNNDSFEYEIKNTDSIASLEKLFKKSWSKIKSEDADYHLDKPEPGKIIKIKIRDQFNYKNSTDRKEKILNALSKYKISESDLIILNDQHVVLIPE